MKIALDTQLAIGTATGIGEYVRGLASALHTEGVHVIELCEPGLDPWRFDRRVIWDQLLLPQRARASGADLLHCTSGTIPFFGPKATQNNTTMPIIVTVHDVAWLRVQAHTKWYARYYFGRFALARYRSATRIVVDSKFSQDELVKVLADDDPLAHVPPIEVVYPGVSEDFFHLTRLADRKGAFGSQSELLRNILVVGTLERRKNLGLLVRALPSLPDARIVSVGPFTPYADECRVLARKLHVEDQLDLRGYVTREELLRLYATCAVVAVPSTYEGFGYAAAQALCAGVPVVVSDRSSLPEIVCNDAPSISIDNIHAWTDALRDALDGCNDDRARQARAGAITRFSCSSMAQHMLKIYSAGDL